MVKAIETACPWLSLTKKPDPKSPVEAIFGSVFPN